MLRLLLAFAALQSANGQVVGDLRLQTLQSNVFGTTRQLRVLVPDGYDAAENRTRRYPVLYLNDGPNLFDSATSALNLMEWRVDELVADLARSGRISPLIVVGIDNAGRQGRFHEYYAWVDPTLRPPDPEVVSCGLHGESAWAGRLPTALTFLYSTQK